VALDKEREAHFIHSKNNNPHNDLKPPKASLFQRTLQESTVMPISSLRFFRQESSPWASNVQSSIVPLSSLADSLTGISAQRCQSLCRLETSFIDRALAETNYLRTEGNKAKALRQNMGQRSYKVRQKRNLGPVL